MAPDTSLYQAINTMIAGKTNKIPIMDPDNGNILYVLNQKPLLKFLLNFVPNLQYFDHLSASLSQAVVGTFQNLQVGIKYSNIWIKTFLTINFSRSPRRVAS